MPRKAFPKMGWNVRGHTRTVRGKSGTAKTVYVTSHSSKRDLFNFQKPRPIKGR